MDDNETGMGAMLRKNWPLMAAMAVCLIVAGILAARSDGGEAAANATASLDISDVAPNVGNPDALAALGVEAAPRKPSETEHARTVIAEHQAAIEADPDAHDVPALLRASGNLYRQKVGDYEAAAEQYENLIYNHPDWPGTRGAYVNLAHCYKQLGEKEKERNLYRRMLTVFEEGTEEHNFAAAQVY